MLRSPFPKAQMSGGLVGLRCAAAASSARRRPRRTVTRRPAMRSTASMIGASMPRSRAMRRQSRRLPRLRRAAGRSSGLAAPERQAIGEIARLAPSCRSAPGRQVRKGPSASRARAPKAAPMRRSSTKPRVTMAAWALAPSAGAGDDAGGDGQDVLQRAADLDADEIVGGIAAEMLRRQSGGERARAFGLARRDDHGGRQARARRRLAKLGPDRAATGCGPERSRRRSPTAGCRCSRSMPLAQSTSGIAVGGYAPAARVSTCAQGLRRRHDEHAVRRRRAPAVERRVVAAMPGSIVMPGR